jgi:selenocysteine lyase/cysteine desulfurase
MDREIFIRPNSGVSLATGKVRKALALRDWMRLSPSIYNDMRDIDRFLEVVS